MFIMASRMCLDAFPISADLQSGTKSKGSQVAGTADDDYDELDMMMNRDAAAARLYQGVHNSVFKHTSAAAE